MLCLKLKQTSCSNVTEKRRTHCPGGGVLWEFLGGDVPLGPWDPGTLSLYQS